MPNDIICLSSHYWNDFWFRKQNFMSRFANLGYRILYVQPTHSMVRRPTKPEIAKNRLLWPFVENVTNKITLLSPPRLFPSPRNPISSRISYSWHAHLIARAAARIGMQDPILWIYRPEFAAGIGFIPHRRLVFDLADDLSSYDPGDTRHSRYIAKCTEVLAKKADLMIVTSPTLFDMYVGRTRRCALVPNGFDESLFDGKPKPMPKDLSKIPRPIVGFVGVLFSFLDYELIAATAQSLPGVSFVFIGPTEESGAKGVQKLKTINNTYFLGSKPRETIPSYITNFDVCINPFRVDAVSEAVSPLKIYEYLACGKPVVSTPMKGLQREEAGAWVTFAQPASFTEELKKALNASADSKCKYERMTAAQAFSWRERFRMVSEYLADIL